MQGADVRKAAPWALRLYFQKTPDIYALSSGTAVPPGDDGMIHWGLISRHDWEKDKALTRHFMVRTAFVDNANRMVGPLINIEDPIEGKGDIVAVHLRQPIQIRKELVPQLDWDYKPKKDATAVCYGFGSEETNVLGSSEGKVIGMVPDPREKYKNAEVVLLAMSKGTTEQGDSGGPVHVNGRTVGVNSGMMVETRTPFFAPLYQEQELRLKLESRPDGIKAAVEDGRVKVKFNHAEL
jgi:hypothetical protein